MNKEDPLIADFIKHSNLLAGIPEELSVPGSPYFDGHLEAFRYCLLSLTRGKLSVRIMLEAHRYLLESLDKRAGKFRSNPFDIVSSSNHVSPLPVYVVPLLERLIDSFRVIRTKNDCLRLYMNFVSILPFSSGNGRVGRCLLNSFRIIKSHPLLITDSKFFSDLSPILDKYQRVRFSAELSSIVTSLYK